MRGLGIPCSSKNTCATYLSAIVAHDLERRREQERRREPLAVAGDDALVDVRHRNDELDVVLGDERRERGR